MKKLNVSLKNLVRFAGMWVAIDPKKQAVIAADKKFQKIASLVSGDIAKEGIPEPTHPYALRVPEKGEAPYILLVVEEG